MVKQFITTKPEMQKILKGILYREEKGKHNHENAGKNKSHQMRRKEKSNIAKQ
jgi:hypothetical protein